MNKFLILIAAFLCIYQVSIAQTEKGNQTAGLNLTFFNSQYNDSYYDYSSSSLSVSKVKNTQLTVGPTYSYFIADKIDVGATFLLTSYVTNTMPAGPDVNSNKFHNRNYEATVFVRKYFLYANKIGVRAAPYLGYFWGNQGYGDSNNLPVQGYSINRNHGYEGGAKLEAVYYPFKNLGISAMIANLEYQHFNGTNGSSSSYEKTNGNTINFAFVSGLALSAFYVFGK